MAGVAYLFALKGYVNALWPGNPIAKWTTRGRRVTRRVRPRGTLVSAAAVLCRREQFLAVGGFDERARMYWEEHELARKLRRLGLYGYYRADAFVYHRWRKGGIEHASSTEAQRYFEEAMRLYYRTFYGRAGGATLRRPRPGSTARAAAQALASTSASRARYFARATERSASEPVAHVRARPAQ